MFYRLPLHRALALALQGGAAGWLPTLEDLVNNGPEVATLLLSFTLAIFVLLVFAVRVLMIATKLPVPLDLFDMAKPKGFRAVMLGSAGLLAPLVVINFFPVEGVDSASALLPMFAFQLVLVLLLWFLLDLFYKKRGKRN